MASEVDICKLALSHIRAGTINSLGESSLQAVLCKLNYPILRDQLLQAASWDFNTMQAELAVSAADPFNWVYGYAYPTDCLYIVRLILNYEEFTATDGAYRTRHIEDIYTPDLDSQVKYKVMNISGNKIIAANEPELRIEYRARVTNTTLFSPLFIKALSYLLAAELAIPLVGADKGRELRSDSLTIYQGLIGDALEADANQEYQEPVDSEFITVRQ